MTEPHERAERLVEVFSRVQHMKQSVSLAGLTPGERGRVRGRVKARLREELPGATPEQIDRYSDVTFQGAAWVAFMLEHYDLSFIATWGVAESLADSVKDADIPADGATGIDLGVGAGFYTGLWVGLLLAEEDAVQKPAQ